MAGGVNASIEALVKLADRLDPTKKTFRDKYYLCVEYHKIALWEINEILDYLDEKMRIALLEFEKAKEELEKAINDAAKDRNGKTKVPDSCYSKERYAKDKYDYFKGLYDKAERESDNYSKIALAILNELERIFNSYCNDVKMGVELLKDYIGLLAESREAIYDVDDFTGSKDCDIINNNNDLFITIDEISATTNDETFRSDYGINQQKEPNDSFCFINLASEKRTNHILYGDETGGGHLFEVENNKSKFPQSWSAEKVMHEVSDIVTSPDYKWEFGRVENGIQRYKVLGERDGVKIVVITEGTDIITAYPVKGGKHE